MHRPKAGLLVFTESLVREDVYRKRKPIADREVERFIKSLEKDVEVIWPEFREIRSKRQAIRAARELEGRGVDAIILYVPIFVSPAVVAHTANLLSLPMALACNEANDSLSQLAFLAVGGAMDQIGVKCERIGGDVGLEPNRSQLRFFLRAAAARTRLRGETYGSIGGRAMGISSGTADLALWERTFGVDIDHVDQFEIVKRAGEMDTKKVRDHVTWLMERAGSVQFNSTNFTPGHLDRQIRSYLATRDIIAEYQFDFIGIKCQPEMSNGYCLQCINVALCNDPYDGDGPKACVPCSCEADADGALTMRVLNYLSGGKATSLNDLAWIGDDEMTLANCGSMATYFTRLSESPSENLAGLQLVPHNFGEAGGGATQFTVPEGIFLTFARFFRQGDRYKLGMLTGVTFEKERQTQSATLWPRPLIFAKIHIDKTKFLQTFGSNHIHVVQGDLKQELKAFSRMVGIESEDYDL